MLRTIALYKFDKMRLKELIPLPNSPTENLVSLCLNWDIYEKNWLIKVVDVLNP